MWRNSCILGCATWEVLRISWIVRRSHSGSTNMIEIPSSSWKGPRRISSLFLSILATYLSATVQSWVERSHSSPKAMSSLIWRFKSCFVAVQIHFTVINSWMRTTGQFLYCKKRGWWLTSLVASWYLREDKHIKPIFPQWGLTGCSPRTNVQRHTANSCHEGSIRTANQPGEHHLEWKSKSKQGWQEVSFQASPLHCSTVSRPCWTNLPRALKY